MKIKQKDKVSVVCAFRIMQSVYSPILKFSRSMKENNCEDHVLMVENYLHFGLIATHKQDISFFKDKDYSFTLNNVSKDIVKLYDAYYKKYNDTFFVALEHVFNCLIRDTNKEEKL